MMHVAEFSSNEDALNNNRPDSLYYNHSFAGIAAAQRSWEAPDARPVLPKAAFFMGDLRDGLPMVCSFCIVVS